MNIHPEHTFDLLEKILVHIWFSYDIVSGIKASRIGDVTNMIFPVFNPIKNYNNIKLILFEELEEKPFIINAKENTNNDAVESSDLSK